MKTKRKKSTSAVIINKDGELLILLRSKDKKFNPSEWNITAGWRKPNEDPEVVIKRKAYKEIGQKITLLTQSVSWFLYQDKHDLVCNDNVFLATVKSDKIILDNKHSEYKWVNFSKLKNYKTVHFLYENLHQIGITNSKAAYKVLYRNWKGKTKWRYISPQKYYFGSTEYHTQNQWLLKCLDHDKKATRTYAVTDILQLIPPLYRKSG